MNELADRRTRAEAQLKVLERVRRMRRIILLLLQPGDRRPCRSFKAAYREGTVKRSDSVEALAKLHGVDARR